MRPKSRRVKGTRFLFHRRFKMLTPPAECQSAHRCSFTLSSFQKMGFCRSGLGLTLLEGSAHPPQVFLDGDQDRSAENVFGPVRNLLRQRSNPSNPVSSKPSRASVKRSRAGSRKSCGGGWAPPKAHPLRPNQSNQKISKREGITSVLIH